MIKFNNITSKEQTEKAIEISYSIEKIDKNKWRIRNKNYDHTYILTFHSVNEWSLEYIGANGFEPWLCRFLSYGNTVEIHRALHNGKTEKSDRFLNKYKQFCCVANSLIQYGYVKL